MLIPKRISRPASSFVNTDYYSENSYKLILKPYTFLLKAVALIRYAK